MICIILFCCCLFFKDISEEENTALSAVSYIGCGISIVCLLIVIIVLVYYRLVVNQVCEDYIHCDVYRNTLLNGLHNFIHLNLAVALVIALIVFVGGIETATDNEVSYIINRFLFVCLHHLCILYSYRLVVQQQLLYCTTSSLLYSPGCCVRVSCFTFYQ